MKQAICGAVLLLSSLMTACGGTGCVQVQIIKNADYYSLQCPTQTISDQCTVGPRAGTLAPKDNNGKDNVFLSTGEWHLNTTASGGASPALSDGTQDDVIINGHHFVVDHNNARLIVTNNQCPSS